MYPPMLTLNFAIIALLISVRATTVSSITVRKKAASAPVTTRTTVTFLTGAPPVTKQSARKTEAVEVRNQGLHLICSVCNTNNGKAYSFAL